MKKLLYLVVTILSLGVIYAAGWASGTCPRDAEEKSAITGSEVPVEEYCPSNDCPDSDGFQSKDRDDAGEGRFGFKIKIPSPPIFREKPIKLP